MGQEESKKHNKFVGLNYHEAKKFDRLRKHEEMQKKVKINLSYFN